MISGVQRRFANLGMAKKLGLGFTLVLLLTALVAAIGVWSLQTIGQRFEVLKAMSSLNSGLLKVRLIEQDYADVVKRALAHNAEHLARIHVEHEDADQVEQLQGEGHGGEARQR